jgi:pSer/pThr/pTyr-binding forkhead associated (FHA) protein
VPESARQSPRVILEVLTSSLSGKRFAYSSEELQKGLWIGRGPECRLRFDESRDLKVSARHALLEERHEGVWLVDAGSSNGLYLNHERVSADGVRVYDGDVVALGQGGARLVVRVPGEPRPQLPEPPTPDGATPPPRKLARTRKFMSEARKQINAARSRRRKVRLGALLALAAGAGAFVTWLLLR